MKNLICLFVLLSICKAYCQVNLSYYLDKNHKYNPEIPKPSEVLGYEVGSWHVSHDQLLNYMYRLAESSDRITIENRGKTYEDRPLILLTITSPKNHKNIRNIQKNHLKLTEINNDLIEDNEPDEKKLQNDFLSNVTKIESIISRLESLENEKSVLKEELKEFEDDFLRKKKLAEDEIDKISQEKDMIEKTINVIKNLKSF